MPLPERRLALFALAMAGSASFTAGQAALAAPVAGDRATILSVGDGDTLQVRAAGRRITIRLACIDAPETAQRPWGQQARAYLTRRLPRGQEVTIVPHSTDRYGRTVAEVISDINIGLVMVEDGQAFASRDHLKGCDARGYLDAEFRASRHRYGVWQAEGGITRPWDFRRGRRAAGISDRTIPDDNRHRCRDLGSKGSAQGLLDQRHPDLRSHGNAEACQSLRR